MPLLSIQTNSKISPDQRDALIKQASERVSTLLGKPEQYVMVSLQDNIPMVFAGSDAPCAYVELKSLGLPEDRTADLSAALCDLIAGQIGIDSGRIYIEFAGPERHMWGWNSGTF